MFRRLLCMTGLTLGIGLVALVSAEPATASACDGTAECLPDLRALEARDISIDRIGKRSRLRFSTLSGNYGPGPLVLRGGEIVSGKSKQRVYQRIHGGETPESPLVREVPVGDFVYHPQHRHFHLEGYALYELLPENDDTSLRRTSAKTSFCVQDTLTLAEATGGAVSIATDTRHFVACDGQLQGMSRGWADRYGARLAGQEIDVTGLPPGDYTLRITINPNRTLYEADGANVPGNNVSEVRLRLGTGTVTLL